MIRVRSGSRAEANSVPAIKVFIPTSTSGVDRVKVKLARKPKPKPPTCWPGLHHRKRLIAGAGFEPATFGL